jgi:hypothetical protein
MNKLPETLSGSITVALYDMELCLNDPDYAIDFSDWHQRYQNYCNVCMGGAVMAKTFKWSVHQNATPSSVTDSEEHKLYALNSVREGRIDSAIYIFYKGQEKLQFSLRFKADFYEEFEDDCYFGGELSLEQFKEFKTQMTWVAHWLEARGY